MSEKKTVLTYDGLKEREEELKYLKTTKRHEVAEKIKDARGQGDLSENAEYDAAKEEQAEIEARIVTLEKMLRNVEVIDEDDIDRSRVVIGSKTALLDLEFGEEVEYTIVGPEETDPAMGRISNESPLGAVLLGRKEGDTIAVEAPAGTIKYKLLRIS